MPWPSKITEAFATVEDGAGLIIHEHQYNGPYNKLLYTLFPSDSDFTVLPNYFPDISEDGTGFVFSLEITFRQHPVLILQVKPAQCLLYPSTRGAADKRICFRLADLLEIAPLPVLYGISAIGTKLCFYEVEKASRRVTPRRTFNDPDLITDVAPQERWDCDVLEADGEQRLRALVTQIMEACEHL